MLDNVWFGYFGGHIVKPPLKTINKFEELREIVGRVSPLTGAKVAFVNVGTSKILDVTQDSSEASVTYFGDEERLRLFKVKSEKL